MKYVKNFTHHKCIMVKVGGNEKHIKYVKNFTKSEGIWKSWGKIIIFAK